jgi:MFS-type transporter involved in bile tolerance (Atg22 family)
MEAHSERHLSAIVLGALFIVSLIAATPFTYAGILWLSASGGWHTQAAAAGLIIGWLALAVGAISVCQAVEAKQRPNRKVVISSCVAAAAAYAIVLEWGGSMLI